MADKGLIYKIHKKAPMPQHQQTQSKIRPKKTFLQRHVDGSEEHEKMVIDAKYYRNRNQNYNELPPHTSQNDSHQQIYKQ